MSNFTIRKSGTHIHHHINVDLVFFLSFSFSFPLARYSLATLATVTPVPSPTYVNCYIVQKYIEYRLPHWKFCSDSNLTNINFNVACAVWIKICKNETKNRLWQIINRTQNGPATVFSQQWICIHLCVYCVLGSAYEIDQYYNDTIRLKTLQHEAHKASRLFYFTTFRLRIFLSFKSENCVCMCTVLCGCGTHCVL